MIKKISVVATLLIAAGAVQAQSNVTLYGIIDLPLEYENNQAPAAPKTDPVTGVVNRQPGGGGRFLLQGTGGLSGSRWGLRGSEDLGGGLKATFWLESGFSSSNGGLLLGLLFSRQAAIGLQSASLGTLSFGRQNVTISDILANFAPMRAASLYDPVYLQLGLNFRSDNVIKYVKKFNAVTAEAHYSFGTGLGILGDTPVPNADGGVPGHFRDNTGYGAGVSYLGNAFGATVIYDQWNPAIVTGNPGTAKKIAVAARYDFGNVQFKGGYRWGRTVDATGRDLLRDDYYWIGANYQVDPFLEVSLAYYFDNLKALKTNGAQPNADLANPWQISFLTDYFLSKRTDVYLTMAYSKNGALNFDSTAVSFASSNFMEQGKNDQFGAAIGIRHRF